MFFLFLLSSWAPRGMILAFEGGAFVWPGMARLIQTLTDRDISRFFCQEFGLASAETWPFGKRLSRKVYPSVHFETSNSNLYVTIRWGRTVATYFFGLRPVNAPPIELQMETRRFGSAFNSYLENSRNQCNQAPLSEVPMQDTIQLLHLLNACHIRADMQTIPYVLRKFTAFGGWDLFLFGCEWLPTYHWQSTPARREVNGQTHGSWS